MGINLKSYVFNPQAPDYSAAKILKEVNSKLDSQKFQQKTGLVTSGYIDIPHNSYDKWCISDLILFSYEYTERPIFTWGLEGSYNGDRAFDTEPGVLTYSMELPQVLADYISNNDTETFCPAMYIPRVIHWYKKSPITWSGCYILIYEVDINFCSEIDDKSVSRLHFRFEGSGYLA